MKVTFDAFEIFLHDSLFINHILISKDQSLNRMKFEYINLNIFAMTLYYIVYIRFINTGLLSTGIFSYWTFLHLGFSPLGFSPLGFSPSTGLTSFAYSNFLFSNWTPYANLPNALFEG